MQRFCISSIVPRDSSIEELVLRCWKISETEKALIQKRAGFHAKYPKQVFSEEKSDEPVPGFLKRSFELYDKIEQVRLSAV